MTAVEFVLSSLGTLAAGCAIAIGVGYTAYHISRGGK